MMKGKRKKKKTYFESKNSTDFVNHAMWMEPVYQLIFLTKRHHLVDFAGLEDVQTLYNS